MIINIKNLELLSERYYEIINLYSYLSKINSNILTFEKFKSIIKNLPDNHNIYVFIENKQIVGAITLLVEQKLIHGGKCVGHIEDFVVHKNYRNKNIGKSLLDNVITKSKIQNCYKCILDCDETLVKYYEKFGFVNKGNFMGLYF